MVAALGVRVALAFYLGWGEGPDHGACGQDAVDFYDMAVSFSHGEGIRLGSGDLTAFRAPGYPMLLGTLFAIFGEILWLNRVLQIVCSLVTVWATWQLALNLRFSRTWAALSALLVACLPLQFYYASHYLSETPAMMFLVLGTLALVVANKCECGKHFFFWITLSGLANGASILIRPASVLLIAIIPLFLLVYYRKTWQKAFLAACLFGLTSVAIFLPWTIRNYQVFGRFALVANNGGSTFWGANNAIVADPSSGHWGNWVSTSTFKAQKEEALGHLDNEVARDKAEYRQGVNFLLENPGKIPLLAAGKLFRMLSPFPLSANRIYVLVVAFGESVLMPLFLIGLWITLRRGHWQPLWPLIAQLVALLGTVLIFYGSLRFRMPYQPIMALFASAAIATLANRFFHHSPVKRDNPEPAQ